ncbi:MAG TPA: hypothetical protein VJX67_06760, partial [Blastocatellia bacterium]|nr:hypothetical protein [Blastocatellia bacterium]
ASTIVPLAGVWLLLVLVSMPIRAQQSSQESAEQKKLVPSLSTDDVIDYRNRPVPRPNAEVEVAAKPPGAKPIGPAVKSNKPSAVWARYSPGNCGLSIELPGEPIAQDLPVPEKAKGVIRYVKRYAYNGPADVILATHTLLTLDVPADVLASAAMGALAGYPGVSDFKYSTSPVSANKVSVKGSYRQGGVALGLQGFIATQGRHTWMVVAIRAQNGNSESGIGQRVLSSVQFGETGCPEN